MSARTGFFEEAPGVRSMTRLVAAALTLGALAIIGAICYVAQRGGPDAAGIIAALTSALVGTAGGVWGALRERTGGEG